MDEATLAIAAHTEWLGVPIAKISRGTDIPYGILRRSLAYKERPLRADEFLAICKFLGVDPLHLST